MGTEELANDWCPCKDGNPGCADHPGNTEFFTEYTITCPLCNWTGIADSLEAVESMERMHTKVHNILGGNYQEA